MTSREQIIKIIKKSMIDKDLTQSEIARRLGVKHQYIWSIMNGWRPIRNIRDQVADMLGLPSSLFEELWTITKRNSKKENLPAT